MRAGDGCQCGARHGAVLWRRRTAAPCKAKARVAGRSAGAEGPARRFRARLDGFGLGDMPAEASAVRRMPTRRRLPGSASGHRGEPASQGRKTRAPLEARRRLRGPRWRWRRVPGAPARGRIAGRYAATTPWRMAQGVSGPQDGAGRSALYRYVEQEAGIRAPRLHPFRAGDGGLCRPFPRPPERGGHLAFGKRNHPRGAANRDAETNRPRAGYERAAACSVELGADLLTQNIDRDQCALVLVVPEGPTIARIQSLHMGGDAMDRTAGIGTDKRAVGAHLGVMTATSACQHHARFQQPALDQRAEGNARLGPFRAGHRYGVVLRRVNGGDPVARQLDIGPLALDADEAARETLGYRAGWARTQERIEHDIARIGRGHDHAMEQAF